jgi:hypothetical protein
MPVAYRLVNLPPFMGIQHRYMMYPDLGCVVEQTWQVRLRPIDAGFAPEDLDSEETPVYVYWDEHRKAWYFTRTWVGSTRNVYIEPNHVSDKAARRTFLMPEDALTDEIVNARIGAFSASAGVRAHDLWWRKGKPSKAVRYAFREWASHVARGGDADDSILWDGIYKRLDSGPGNMLYDAVTWYLKRANSPPAPGDIFVLRSNRHTEVVYEIVGIPPDVDWCALSEAIAAEHAKG